MLAIVGGTGLYNLEGFELLEDRRVDTPFGNASANVKTLKFNDKKVLFLPRHGEHHQFLPHEINYRANVFALKSLGATQILGFSAVGSLSESIHPGEFALPSQYFDWVKGSREKTFFGEGVAAHVSTAEPTSQVLAEWVYAHARDLGFPIHKDKTYACVDGPRLGTKAESNFLRLAGCHLVGMTNVPEVFLAREAQMDYATVGIVTDYDCWMEDPSQHVTVERMIERYGESLKKSGTLLASLLSSEIPEPEEKTRTHLNGSLLTPLSAIPSEKVSLIDVLRR